MNPVIPVTLAGQTFKLQFQTSDSPTKKGIKLQFVMDQAPEDPRDVQELANKISIVLQKKLGAAGIAVDYDERNPYKNVISFIVPMQSIANMITGALKGGA